MNEQRRFGMTAWPGTLPPITRVIGFSPYRLDGDLLKLDLGAAMVTHEIPDELYLRELFELDLSNEDAVLAFIHLYGRLGHPAQPVRRAKGGEVVHAPDGQVIRELGVDLPNNKDLPWDDWWTEVDNSVEDLGKVEKGLFFQDGLQHIDTFRGWALAFKRLTRLYQNHQMRQASASEMDMLGRILTDLLRPFAPVLDVVEIADAEAKDWSPFRDTYLAPRLENVLALQIFDHIAATDVYQMCANENHGGLFVRQRGRAEVGQYRTRGVLYCSRACAQAQSSRNYRLRKKEVEGK